MEKARRERDGCGDKECAPSIVAPVHSSTPDAPLRPVVSETVLRACAVLSKRLQTCSTPLCRFLSDAHRARLSGFLQRDCLETYLRFKLGSDHPFQAVRTEWTDSRFESWAPRGRVLLWEVSRQPLFAAREVVVALALQNTVSCVDTGAEDAFFRLWLQELGRADTTGALVRAVDYRQVSAREARGSIAAQSVVRFDEGSAADAVIKARFPTNALFSAAWQHGLFYIAADHGEPDLPARLVRLFTVAFATQGPRRVSVLLEQASLGRMLAAMLSRDVQERVHIETISDPDAIAARESFHQHLEMSSSPRVGVVIAPAHRVPRLAHGLALAGCDDVVTLPLLEQNGTHPSLVSAYVRRVRYRLPCVPFALARFPEDVSVPPPPELGAHPVLSKEAFNSLPVEPKFAQLYCRSGGSSGEAKLAVYSYADFDTQTRFGAEGLLAAGLDPRRDRCLNVFSGGGLYGAFPIFYRMLEHLSAVQFPMMTHPDLDWVARIVVEHRINAILGMPSYVLRLFSEQGAVLRAYGGIEKIFYAGEPLTAAQKRHLHTFGVRVIKSAAYGSVDTGPVAYQCRYCEGGEHHLHPELQYLEILAHDADRPVGQGEVGRLIFSSRVRRGQTLLRYDLGDLGRWVDGACACGRAAPRFEVLGRHGDAFKAAGLAFNYHRFLALLCHGFNYAGELQIELESDADRELVRLKLDEAGELQADAVVRYCLAHDRDLQDSVQRDALRLSVVNVRGAQFQRSASSGKLLHVIDRRGPI